MKAIAFIFSNLVYCKTMIIVDIETTGWDPYKSGIASIGAIDFDHPTNTFYGECRVRDNVFIDPGAFAVNGFTDAMLHDMSKPTEEKLVRSFLRWSESITNKTLGGHNVGYFDANFLRITFERYNISWPFYRRTVDLHSVAYANMLQKGMEPQLGVNGVSSLSLDVILANVGLPTEPKPHNALNGAKYEAEALARLCMKKCLLQEFEKFPMKG